VNRSVPIIIGGHTEAAARRAGRLGDGFFPGRGLPMELIDVVRRTARETGRDPADVEITMGMPDDLERIPELAAAGVSRVLLPVTGVAGLARRLSGPEDLLGWRETIERYATP
jgi:alkanesulfonate monooxygenase SsuD/methylene tetrahydromethanopterin reductase-like flavin-dependent oxidoreductase (luciferase family)